MDAKDWSKMADMIAQIRRRLYKIQSDNEHLRDSVFLKSFLTREYLALALDNIDTLARYANNGWIK